MEFVLEKLKTEVPIVLHIHILWNDFHYVFKA